MKYFRRDWITILIVTFITCLVFYGYYFITKESDLDIVYKNWDGPGYVLAAMSLYSPEIAYKNNFFSSADIHPDWTWLPAHFPLVPFMIRGLSFLGYFPAMLAVGLVFTALSYIALYELVRSLKITKNPLLVTLPFIFLSPRWFVVSHVGSSESAFMFFMLLFLLFFYKKKHTLGALFGALAQFTRPHGVFIFIGVCCVALWELYKEKNLKKTVTYLPYLAMPAVVFAVFAFYKIQTGNFFAFFEAIALTSNLRNLPFLTFTFPNTNLETFWQEVNALDYVIYLAASLALFRKKLWQFGIIAIVYFIPLIFIQHTDISRYAIPLLPFAFIGFSEVIEKKEFTLATLLMSPAVIMYAINFMDHNHGS